MKKTKFKKTYILGSGYVSPGHNFNSIGLCDLWPESCQRRLKFPTWMKDLPKVGEPKYRLILVRENKMRKSKNDN